MISNRYVQIISCVDSAEHVFALEAAGVVRHTGPQAKKLQIGERVMVFARNTFSSFITESEFLCVKCPNELKLFMPRKEYFI